MKKIILASGSPRRKELMSKLGIPFEIQESSYQEDMKLKMKPKKLAKYLSLGKARAVALRYKKAIVIGADTFVALGDELLGKPHTKQEAEEMLKKISGKVVSVITGMTVIDSDSHKFLSEAVETKIFFRKLSDSEINNYIRTGEPMDKAGAFAIQGLGAVFIKKIEGDYIASVGLSLFTLEKMLKKFGIEVI